jgi:hypothetical protein
MVSNARRTDSVGMSSSITLAFICTDGCPELVAAFWTMVLGVAAVVAVLIYLVARAIHRRLS